MFDKLDQVSRLPFEPFCKRLKLEQPDPPCADVRERCIKNRKLNVQMTIVILKFVILPFHLEQVYASCRKTYALLIFHF